MLIYNADFEQHNASLSKEPRWVAVIDFTGLGDLHYFTSHAGTPLPAGLTAAEYTHSVLKIRTLASQTLDPKEGRATIGSIAFDLLDINGAITTLLQEKLDAGSGINKKVVQVYKGYSEHTDFATQFELVATQIASKSLTFDRASLSWQVQCADPQHLLKKTLFSLAKTNITALVSVDATTINVGSTSSFEMFEHDAGYDDAPSQTVGYLKLKKSNSEFELVRYTGKTGSTFTGITRAVMGSKALEHVYLAGTEADRQIEVEEYVYLEGPIIKIAYAILTGSLYGQAGKALPSGWHLGIDTAFVSTATFTGIGADVWDTTDPAVETQRQCRFQGISKQDGKTFFERELMLLAGCFHTIRADGQIAAQRMADAAPTASTLGTLDASNIISATSLENTLADVANLYRVTWNWEDLLGRYTRENLLVDGDSIATHDLGQVKEYKFRGMYGNRMTVDRLYSRFDSLRSMYAGPPLQLSVTTLGTVDVYEVGDTVRVTLEGLRDFTNGIQHSLDRAFHVFGKSINARSGCVTYKLFGSSQKAGAMPAPSITGLTAVLPDSFYSTGLNGANNIQTMALTVDPVNGFEIVGGVGILKTNITCTGVAGNVNHVNSVFWYDGDLEIASGVTVTVVNGAQFRSRGYFENKGIITGKGRGLAGGAGYTVIPSISPIGAAPGNPGVGGFIGSTTGAGGLNGTLSHSSASAIGSVAAMPPVSIEWDGEFITGIPGDMRGTSGGAGGGSYNYQTFAWVAGGAGGDGGCPVVIVSRGFANNLSTGSIDVSGNDGELGFITSSGSYNYYSGSGAGGAPGGVLFIIDGQVNSVTGTSLILANRGACQVQGTPNISANDKYPANPAYSYYIGTQAEDMSAAVTIIAYVTGTQTPQEDVPETTGDPLSITAVEVVNYPVTIEGDKSSIEIAVTAPTDSNYDYSNIYYRIYGSESPWVFLAPASPEAVHVVTADGTVYEYQARSVSVSGVESHGGPVTSITTTSVYKLRPDTPTGFVVTRSGAALRFMWNYDPSTKIYEIRRGTSWSSSVLLGRPIAPPFDVDSALAGTYLIKAVDNAGTYCAAAATVVMSTAADINIVVTHDEESGGWNGTTSSTIVTADGVELAGTLTWAGWDQSWASYTQSWAKESVIASTGTYVSEIIDLGKVLTSRVEIDPVIEQVAIADNWAAWNQQWAYYSSGWTWTGPLGIVTATFEIDISDDGVSWAGFRGFIIGDYSARYIRFRATLNTADGSYNCRLSQLLVTVDVPDRVIEFADEVIPSGGKAVSFTPAFEIVPVMAVTVQGGAIGDTVKISGKTASGATIEVFDSSGITKAASVDITARGY